jgi:L-asparagine oxygenase
MHWTLSMNTTTATPQHQLTDPCTVPEAHRRAWDDAANKIRLPNLKSDPRAHAQSIADEADLFSADRDPYSVAVTEGTKLAKTFLPDSVLEALEQFRRGDAPFVCIHGLPIGLRPEDVPPSDGKRPASKSWTSEMTILGVAKAAGLEPLSYTEEALGALVHEVAPVLGREQTNSGTGRKPLGWHVDNAIHPRWLRAEGLALLGLVNPERIPTRLATLDDLLTVLTAEQIATLAQPLFRFPLPESFDLGQGFLSEPRAVLSHGPDGQMEIGVALYNVLVSARRDDARLAVDALEALDTALDRVSRSVLVGPGDMLLFSNLRCLHARNVVPGSRWLQRIYFRESIAHLHSNAAITTGLHRRFSTRSVLAGF